MIALPWGISAFAAHEAGMAFSLLLFFVVDPVWSILTGIFSARDSKRLWPMPLISAGLFVLGTWISFEWLQTDFLWYAAAYAAIGTGAMLLTILMCRKKAPRTA